MSSFKEFKGHIMDGKKADLTGKEEWIPVPISIDLDQVVAFNGYPGAHVDLDGFEDGSPEYKKATTANTMVMLRGGHDVAILCPYDEFNGIMIQNEIGV